MLDTILHTGISCIIMISAFYLLRGNLCGAIIITLLIGIAKEVYDFIDYGLFSMSDIAFDLMGVYLGFMIIMVIESMLEYRKN